MENNNCKSLLEAVEFGGGGGGAAVEGFAGVEVIDEVEGEAATVVALAFVDEDAVGIHGPVVAGGIEKICSRKLYSEYLAEESLVN